MAASCSRAAKLEDELRAYGMKLMNPPSSTDELLNLLDKVESLLIMVGQHPSDSTRSALQPVMKALIRNEILRHTNEDVKVSVVSCITELSRITAPKYPYDDHKQMEEILMHTVMALKKLSDVSGRSYRKVVQILETVAKLRACVMLLDFQYDTLVIKIFKLFLGTIRPYHPHNIFTRMKEIMTQLIEDSDELSVELLRPLLESVTIENQMASPISSKLGEKVLEECAAIVRPYLAEALKSMSLGPNDAEIVASICNKMPKGEETMVNENAPDTVHPVKVGPSEAKFCEPAWHDDTQREKLKDSCTTDIMKPDNPEDVQPATNAEVSSKSNKLTGSSGQHSLVSENHNINTGSHGQPKNNESPINEDAQLALLVPAGDVPQSQVQEIDSLHLGLTWGERTKRTRCAKRKSGRDSRKNESAFNCDAERKSESSIKNEEGNIKKHMKPSLQQIDGMKQQKNEITIMMHNIEESGDKTTKLSVRDENHFKKYANYKSGRKFATRKHEDSTRARAIKDHGEELVGAKIKVWWPLDEAFYEATVSSFDPVENKHKVVYVDGDVERLKLYKERWEILEDHSSQKVDTHREQLKDTRTTKPENPDDGTEAEVILARRNKLTGSSAQHSSVSKSPDVSHGSHGHWSQPKKNKTPTNEDHLGVLVAAGDVPESQVKRKGSLHLGLAVGERSKHMLCAKRKPGRDSRKNASASNCVAECKAEFSMKSEEVSLQQIHGMKQRKKKTAIKIYDFEESGDKTTKLSVRDENPLNKCANYKPGKKLATAKNEDSKRPHTIKDYGEELIGARINIWWPLDKMFYEAAVSSFDPVKRRHKVIYVDGDVEKLSLHKERWEMLEDNSSQKDHGLEFQGHAVSSVKSSRKKAKRNSSAGPNISSSKRSKSTAK